VTMSSVEAIEVNRADRARGAFSFADKASVD
jgi:hypothetical protein